VRFEVASIRPIQPGARVSRINFHGDFFEAGAVRVGDILDMLNGYQLLRVVRSGYELRLSGAVSAAGPCGAFEKSAGTMRSSRAWIGLAR